MVGRLQNKDVHFIGRNHHARKLDFRRGTKIDANQRRQTWVKPRQQPRQSRLPAEQWEQLPDTLTVRIIRTYGPDRQGRRRTRYVVTTWLDHEAYLAEEEVGLYAHRWGIEPRFRDIKTTMGMELLRTQSPAMVEKELLMHLLAYNVIRLLMLKAGQLHGVNHRRISSKGVLQVLAASRVAFQGLGRRPRLLERERDHLLACIAERVVRERPGRNEPRKKKRRPKSSTNPLNQAPFALIQDHQTLLAGGRLTRSQTTAALCHGREERRAGPQGRSPTAYHCLLSDPGTARQTVGGGSRDPG